MKEMTGRGVQYDFSNTTVLITGSDGLLGQIIARKFADSGANLILHVLQKSENIETFACSLPGDHFIIAADLSIEKEIVNLFSEIENKTGRLDVLINNAGLQDLSSLEEIGGDDWDKMMKVNLKAPHICIRELAALTKKKQTGNVSIINIASIESESPSVLHSHYCASKGGLVQYTRAAALELGDLGIRVNAISPGLIIRPGIEEQWPEGVARFTESSPLKGLIEGESIADAAMFLASKGASAITGINLRVDKGVGVTPGY